MTAMTKTSNFLTFLKITAFLTFNSYGIAYTNSNASDSKHRLGDIEVTENPWDTDYFRWGLTPEPKAFQNPVLDPNLPELPGASEDSVKVPEGLTVTGDGKIRQDRNTIIFVHGWSYDGKAEPFHMPKLWNEQGFNTLIYRWHRGSFDRSAIPVIAQERVWTYAGENLYQDYIQKLGPALSSNYKKEIRVVGHSLGTQMGAYLIYRLQRSRYPLMVKRFDMIDPVVGEDLLPEDSPISSLIPESLITHSKQITIKEAMRYILTGLTHFPPKVPTVAYLSLATILTQAIQYDRIWESRPLRPGSWSSEVFSVIGVYDAIHVQAMKRSWLFDLFETFTGSRRNFLEQLVYFFSLQHILLKDIYMESIDPIVDAPLVRYKTGKVLKAFDAKFPTEDLAKIKFRRYYSQISGNSTVEMEDDLFEPIRINPGCNERIAGRIEFKFCF